jgi:hypothetical protein
VGKNVGLIVKKGNVAAMEKTLAQQVVSKL